MAIVIIDNFQVNISNPIDNRFVVGSQSITSGPGSNYPTPFYKFRGDIVYKYPGLRIWDFNDNIPYVWNGTDWINENTTGALIQGSGGHQNYIAKFIDNTTLLSKSLIFDNNSNVAIGLISDIDPNSLNYTSIPNKQKGLHVAGNIKTNAYFIGNIHADYIVSGKLKLSIIENPQTQGLDVTYFLKSLNGITSWDVASSILPIPINLTTTTSDITTGNLYVELVNNKYTFRPIISSGLLITQNTNDLRIENKAGLNLGSSNIGQAIYKGLNSQNIHEYYKLNSSTLKFTNDGNYLNIDSKNDYIYTLSSSTNGVLSVNFKISAMEVGDFIICKALVDKTIVAQIEDIGASIFAVIYSGSFKVNEYVRMIKTSVGVSIVRLADDISLDSMVSGLSYLKKTTQTEENTGSLDTVATTPLSNKTTFKRRVNGTDSDSYLAVSTGTGEQNGLLSKEDKTKLDILYNKLPRNVGSFGDATKYFNPPVTTGSFPRTGDIVSAVADSNGILVTMLNAMPNINYYIRCMVESLQTGMSDANLGGSAFRKINNTQFYYIAGEPTGGTQMLRIHFEVLSF